jgi:hypothetical protein
VSTTIWKFPLGYADDVITIAMPEGAAVLHVAMQDGRPHLWARVDPAAPKVLRHFRWAGTGHNLTNDVGEHLGTWTQAGDQLVFHLFAMGETRE